MCIFLFAVSATASCLSFHYCMNGADVSTFTVSEDRNDTKYELWSESADQGHMWHQATISILSGAEKVLTLKEID